MTKYYDQNGTEIPYDKVAESFIKKNIEFDRYKQDCRKRALDVALQLFSHHGGDNNDEGEKEIDIKTIADKYYDWLISIP